MTDASKDAVTMTREVFFPTLIYYRDLPEADALNREIIPHIYKWRAEDERGIQRSNVRKAGSWHSHLDMATRPEYVSLVDQIMDCAQLIFDEMGYDPAYSPMISNMWANVNSKGGYNRSHVHPNVHWSGVYYVQSGEDSGRIMFCDPRYQAQMYTPRFTPGKDRKPEAWNEVYYEPKCGRLILFPSWLMHEVEPNMSELEGPAGERISVSFNIDQYKRSL